MNTLTISSIVQEQTIGQGAEALIFKAKYLGYDVICKERRPKEFRLPQIDYKLRKERTTQEVRLLQLCRQKQIPVPLVLDVIKERWMIIMQEIKGKSIKHFIGVEDTSKFFKTIGAHLGTMHSVNVIHGDLTTSNMLLDPMGKVWFIDFGLGFISPNIEDKAVDLLVLKHTLESSHPAEADELFKIMMRAYGLNNKQVDQVTSRMEQVEMRVRYRSH